MLKASTLAGLLGTAVLAFAQTDTPPSYLKTQHVGLVTMPTVQTTIAPSTVYLDAAWFNNTTSGDITVYVLDRSTNCDAGAACKVISQVVSAGSVWYPPISKVPANGGLAWYASAAGVHAWIQWRF